jgi:phage terminase small subunit
MPRGPKPKPPALRIAEGKPGHRPLPEVPRVAPVTEMPEPPSDLTEIGQMAWNLVGGGLHAVGHLQTPFLPLLRLFAQACDLADRAWREMADEDLVRRGARGGGTNPAVKVWRDAAGTARAIGEQLGASPVAMARLGLAQVRGMSMAQELQARKDESERKGRNR